MSLDDYLNGAQRWQRIVFDCFGVAVQESPPDQGGGVVMRRRGYRAEAAKGCLLIVQQGPLRLLVEIN